MKINKNIIASLLCFFLMVCNSAVIYSEDNVTRSESSDTPSSEAGGDPSFSDDNNDPGSSKEGFSIDEESDLVEIDEDETDPEEDNDPSEDADIISTETEGDTSSDGKNDLGAQEESFYMDEDGETHKITNYEKITGEHSELKLGKTNTESWYVFDGNVKVTGRIYTSGKVNLVLSANCVAECEGGIVVEEEYDRLIIWGQEKEGGKIIAKPSSAGDAAIGSRKNNTCGTIDIHSGYIEADSTTLNPFGSAGAAIGSGEGARFFNEITILGGVVKATGGLHAAGIGGGNRAVSGFITIRGGTIEAKGGQYAAGIGSGDSADYKNAGEIYIDGGNVTAFGGEYGAGIGGGDNVSGGPIRIRRNAVVEAYGDGSPVFGGGAGIGGGDEAGAGDITIEDGTVTAKGGSFGAGIGTGDESGGGTDADGHNKSGTVTIRGGNVTATGGAEAAGIGGGNESKGIYVYIFDGEVTAKGSSCGAGIGGGDKGDGGRTQISGGKVTATGGENAAGIGGGQEGKGGYTEIERSAYVVATGTSGGAGIGSGEYTKNDAAPGGETIIHGGTVIATGGSDPGLIVNVGGAGIGSGKLSDQNTIDLSATIEIVQTDSDYPISITAQGGKASAGIGGGTYARGAKLTIDIGENSTVTARGGYYGAGIGSGNRAAGNKSASTASGILVIERGNVYAYGGDEAAGIGGGNETDSSSITINGGNIYAEGGKYAAGIGGGDNGDQKGTITIRSAVVTAIGSGKAAGIGGGENGTGGTVIIENDATVLVKKNNKAMPIGNAEGETGSSYSLSLYEEASVTAGNSEDSSFIHYTSERIPACQNRDYNYVLIRKCIHQDKGYEFVDVNTHLTHCKHCEHIDGEEGHEIINGRCVKCNFDGFDIHILSENGSGEEDLDHIDAGISSYVLPACGFTPAQGKRFAGWDYSFADIKGNGLPGDTIEDITSDVTLKAVWIDSQSYQIFIDDDIQHGSITSPSLAKQGERVFVEAAPESGYVLHSLTYTKLSSKETFNITDVADDGRYYFDMPEDDVRISAVFLNPSEVQSVSVDPTSLEMDKGDTATLIATVMPDTAANKDVLWSSSDESIATVDENGVVTAIEPGGAIITVTTVDGGKTAQCKVKVNHAHSLSHVDEVLPTCEEKGYKAHYECSICKELFIDAEGTQSVTLDQLVIDPLGHDFSEWTVTKEATEFEEGEETRVCKRCGYQETHTIEKIIVYHVIKGGGSTWHTGSDEDLVFVYVRSDSDSETFSHFTGIEIDGKTVDKNNYEARSGSVIITLKPAFLENLKTGRHILAALFDDGVGLRTTFTIERRSIPDDRSGGEHYIIPITGVEKIRP